MFSLITVVKPVNPFLNRLKINMKGYTLRERNSVIFSLGSLPHRSQHLKVRICSSRSKFFPFSVDLFFERVLLSLSKQEVMKVVALCKYGRKNRDILNSP